MFLCFCVFVFLCFSVFVFLCFCVFGSGGVGFWPFVGILGFCAFCSGGVGFLPQGSLVRVGLDLGPGGFGLLCFCVLVFLARGGLVFGRFWVFLHLGHGAWGMGRGAWGVVHGVWGMGPNIPPG